VEGDRVDLGIVGADETPTMPGEDGHLYDVRLAHAGARADMTWDDSKGHRSLDDAVVNAD